MVILENHIADIHKLCSTYKVKHLYAFGSILTENFNTDSDIDLVVDFEPNNYYDFKFSLQDVLQRPVYLLEEKAIKNPYLKQSINQQRQLIMDIKTTAPDSSPRNPPMATRRYR